MIQAFVFIEAEPTRVQELVGELHRPGVGRLGDQGGLRRQRPLGPDRPDREPGFAVLGRLSDHRHRERRGRSTHGNRTDRLDRSRSGRRAVVEGGGLMGKRR